MKFELQKGGQRRREWEICGNRECGKGFCDGCVVHRKILAWVSTNIRLWGRLLTVR